MLIEMVDAMAFFESDPNGKSQHEPGSKMDAGKNRLGLVFNGFSHALQAVGAVGTFGANKYTEEGWKAVPGAKERYTDAPPTPFQRVQRRSLGPGFGSVSCGAFGLERLR